VTAIEATASGVDFTVGGAGRHADLLVAADGVHSDIRKEFFGYSGPRSLGRTAWRATLDASQVAGLVALDEVGLSLGAGGHMVHYPISGESKLNLVVIAKGETPAPPTSPFGPAARKLIALPSGWIVSPLLATDAEKEWSKDKVLLVGDSAHAMAPSSAQGGAQAIEDAWTLAAMLESGDAVRAFASYSRLRGPRVKRVADAALRNLNGYELQGVPANIRNALLRVLPATLFNSQLDWLFGWKPE
jgi:salicylate hydroxylase